MKIYRSRGLEVETVTLADPQEILGVNSRKELADVSSLRGLMVSGSPLSPDRLAEAMDDTSVRVGFTAVASKERDVYAVYHEFGTRFMPRRGLLTADPERGELAPADEQAVLDVVETFLSDLLE